MRPNDSTHISKKLVFLSREIRARQNCRVSHDLIRNAVRAKIDSWKFPKSYPEYEGCVEKLGALETELAELEVMLQENDVHALRAKLDGWNCPSSAGRVLDYPEVRSDIAE